MTTTTTDLAVSDDPVAVKALLALEKAGVLTAVSLDLTDPKMKFERWEALGRLLGTIDRSTRWWLGDWLNFGEAIFGDEHLQGIDDTTKTRYSEAERVTGLDHDTLLNVSSICRRIAKDRRRKELGFWIHSEVAALDPEEQTVWLQAAIENGWTKSQLREEIRASKNPPSDEPEPEPGGEGGRLSPSEQLLRAATLVVVQATNDSDGNFVVPPEPMAQLRAAIGEE